MLFSLMALSTLGAEYTLLLDSGTGDGGKAALCRKLATWKIASAVEVSYWSIGCLAGFLNRAIIPDAAW